MRTIVRPLACGIVVLCTLFLTHAAAELKLGVLAPRGGVEAEARWQAFAAYLSQQLAQPVSLMPLRPPSVVPTAQAGQVDLVLSHAAHTVYLKERHAAVPLATLNGKEGPLFAGVIVAKSGNGIRTVEDLKGKRGMSLKFKEAAGAYIFQTYHLMQKGIDPHRDFASLQEGKKQDDLVLAVQAGLIDVAFVRSGLLEAMEREGKIKMADFLVVDQRTGDNFSFVHSTDLYPEWYISALSKVPAAVQEKIKAALLHMTPDMPAAKAVRVQGFVAPLPLEGMQKALQALKIPPYDA